VTRVTPVARGPVEALLSSLNLGPQQGLDPEPDNIVAVGTFTSTPPGQPPQQVRGPYCMLPQQAVACTELCLGVLAALHLL